MCLLASVPNPCVALLLKVSTESYCCVGDIDDLLQPRALRGRKEGRK